MGIKFIVLHRYAHRKRLLALLLFAPLMGCTGWTNTDLFNKDTEWFSQSGRLFIKNVSIDAPPLNADKPVTAEDLVSADGACPGMAPPGGPSNANALADGAAVTPSTTGTVALGHTECDVVRGIGVPNSVNLSRNERGDRVAVVNYSQGQRAGIYTFTAGRLTSIERGSEPAPAPKSVKPRVKKKQPTAT